MSSQKDVIIGMEAEDNASLKIDSATERINKSFKKMKDEQRAVTRSFEMQNQTLVASQRVINVFGQGINRALSIYNSWNLLNIRIQDSNRNVRDSLKDVNEAFVDFGPDSKQFKDALQSHQDALEDQKNTQRDVSIGYALMISSIIADTARLAVTVLPRLRVLRSAIRGVAGVPGSAAAPSPAFPNAGGAGAGAVAGAGMASKAAIVARGSGIVAGGAIGATILENAFPNNPLTDFRDRYVTPAVRGAERAVGDFINKTFNINIFSSDPNQAGNKVKEAMEFYD